MYAIVEKPLNCAVSLRPTLVSFHPVHVGAKDEKNYRNEPSYYVAYATQMLTR